MAAFAGWEWHSPYRALDVLGDYETAPETRSGLYDRAALRRGFAKQTVPQVDDYPPPLTKDVLLDALVDPRAVQLLAIEPYGQWQPAAYAGLADEVKTEIDAEQGADPSPMPRILETTESWSIERRGWGVFVATPADREGGHSYTFERAGLGWRLVHIQLSEPIR